MPMNCLPFFNSTITFLSRARLSASNGLDSNLVTPKNIH
jgi:hypothetical protein